MQQLQVFNLPDLGEGLPDAEIVQWQVAVGDTVTLDQAMVSMETAKAVVDVPCPYAGRIAVLHGAVGEVIETGAALVTFDTGDGASAASDSGAEDTANTIKPTETGAEQQREDSGTVVGVMAVSNQLISEQISNEGGVKVTPAVRALSRKLAIDLSQIIATGKNGVITAKDVRQAAADGSAAIDAGRSPTTATPSIAQPLADPIPPTADTAMTPIRGVRRSMARVMAEAHAQVVPTCITEDADVSLWEGKQDLTVRMIRALVAGARREPALNAWFDPDGPQRLIHQRVHVGIAVDTADGLFVPTLRDADLKTSTQLREQINRLRENIENRSIPAEELTGYTLVFSNFGVFTGKYSTPIVTPPCVCILASGRMRDQVVAAHGGIAVHPVIPLSLSFDHRAATGGEAARFLAALIDDLGRPY